MIISLSACGDPKDADDTVVTEKGQLTETDKTDKTENGDKTEKPAAPETKTEEKTQQEQTEQKTESTDGKKADTEQKQSDGKGKTDLPDGTIVSSTTHIEIYLSPDELEKRSVIIASGTFDGNSTQLVTDGSVPASYEYQVFNDCNFVIDKTAKGSPAESIKVRTAGGISGDILYMSDGPQLEAGKKYLLFLRQSPALTADDNAQAYLIIGHQGCIPINDDGTLDFRGIHNSEDQQGIQRIYDSAK